MTSWKSLYERLSKEARQTWQYLKGAKKLPRKAASGHEYIFSEGPIEMIDSYDKPARTMLTSEGGFSRTTQFIIIHICTLLKCYLYIFCM